MKKLLALTLTAILAFSMIGCASKTEEAASESTAETAEVPAEATGDSYKVAIVKQLDHASLDEIANAVAAQFDAVSAEKGITIEYEIYSGQNDQSTIKQIGDQAVAEGVDAIVPSATMAAQVMTVCAEGTGIPVVYAAVSDPVAAELTGID